MLQVGSRQYDGHPLTAHIRRRSWAEPAGFELAVLRAAVTVPAVAVVAPVPVLLDVKISKFGNESSIYPKSSDVVLQSFELPLSAFVTADPRFEPASLAAIRFVFDRSKEGAIALDDVALAIR